MNYFKKEKFAKILKILTSDVNSHNTPIPQFPSSHLMLIWRVYTEKLKYAQSPFSDLNSIDDIGSVVARLIDLIKNSLRVSNCHHARHTY